MYDEYDAARDDFYDRMYQELGPQWAEDNGFVEYGDAINDFTSERLQSYYLAHTDVARPAHDSLVTAEALLGAHPNAALVFGTTAIELAVKNVLLKPIVFGLVHTEAVANFIAELTVQHNGMDRFRGLLSAILKSFGGVDLQTFRRTGSTMALNEEIERIQKARNAVIHRGESPDKAMAELSIVVASAILNDLFPQVLKALGLHLEPPHTISPELTQA